MTARLLLAAIAVATVVAAPAEAQRRSRTAAANPSAAIAAEVAFARMAQEKGQWTAFRAHAAPDAVMFVPQMVLAQEWLKDRADPSRAVTWQPHMAWSSCDGSLVATHGAWQGAAGSGYFTTIWQRQPKGGYKWVLDHGDTMAFPLDAPEMIQALVAECPEPAPRADKPKRRKGKEPAVPFDPARRAGQSDDGSLAWEVTVTPQGARNVSVTWRKDGAMGPALIEAVEAPPPLKR